MKTTRLLALIFMGIFLPISTRIALAGDYVPIMTNSPFKNGIDPACGTCISGSQCCTGSCVNVNTSITNCGSCGVACDTAKTDTCTAGICKCGTGNACFQGQFCDAGTCREGCGEGSDCPGGF